jgi:hypothetical protein
VPREAKALRLFAVGGGENAYLLSLRVPEACLDAVKSLASQNNLLAVCASPGGGPAEALIELLAGERGAILRCHAPAGALGCRRGYGRNRLLKDGSRSRLSVETVLRSPVGN